MTDEQSVVEIRDGVSADLDLIYDFIHQLAVHEKRPEAMTASKTRLYELIFGGGPASVLLAFSNGAPAGFALYYPVVSTFSGHLNLYVEDMLVLPDARRHGVARKLMEALRDKEGVDGLKWTCLADNETGLAFHRAVGAEEGLLSIPFYMSKEDDHDGSRG